MSNTQQQRNIVPNPSSSVGEIESHQQQRVHEKIQPGLQQQPQYGGISTAGQTRTVVTTTTTTGLAAGGVGGGGQVQQLDTRLVQEPTIDYFNRFVAKDTHCLLGKTGIKLNRICLGSMNFGKLTDTRFGERPGQLAESEAHALLDRYVELGGNCVDTANFFPWFGNDVGRTETIIGNWLSKQERERIFITTKVRMPLDMNNINSVGLSRAHLIDSVNKSLQRLQTDTIDMLLLNGWDCTVSFHETVKHLDDLVREDKIRYIGVCDMKGWQLQKFIDVAKELNLHRCVCYMGEYNLLTRGCELEVLDVCKNERIGFIAYSPLKYGFLSDDTARSPNNPVANSRIEAATNARKDNRLNIAAMSETYDYIANNPHYMNVLNACQQLASKYGVSISQIAIQWILQRGVVTSVCVGVEDVKELEQAMSCLIGEFVLTENEMNQLDLVSSVHLHYPYHTKLSDIAGYRSFRAIGSTQFEQMNILTHALELDTDREQQRMNLTETWHESKSPQAPEREFMRYPQEKARWQQLQQQPFSTGLVAQQAFLQPIAPAKIIQ